MRHILTISASAFLLMAGLAAADDSSSASSSSLAPSSTVSSVSSEPSSSSSSASSSAVVDTAMGLSWGSLMSAIQTGSMTDLSVITGSTTIQVVTVSSLKANGNTNALDNALKKRASAITTLRASVAANATLSARLTAGGFTATQVVAVTTLADGTVIVFVDDRA